MTIDWSTSRLTGRWKSLTEEFLASPEGKALRDRIDAETEPVYPVRPFTAEEMTPFERVRVVIVGQDPYHGKGQPHGLFRAEGREGSAVASQHL